MRIDFAKIRARRETSLFSEIVAEGVEYANHETDLYIPDTEQARTILRRFPAQNSIATRFRNQLNGQTWIDIPFAYLPAWDRKTKGGK